MLNPDVGTSKSFNFIFFVSRNPYFGGSKFGAKISPLSNLLKLLIFNYLLSSIIVLRSGLDSTEPTETDDDEFSVSFFLFLFFTFFVFNLTVT